MFLEVTLYYVYYKSRNVVEMFFCVYFAIDSIGIESCLDILYSLEQNIEKKHFGFYCGTIQVDKDHIHKLYRQEMEFFLLFFNSTKLISIVFLYIYLFSIYLKLHNQLISLIFPNKNNKICQRTLYFLYISNNKIK